jgi:M6 family metalloprotease-like protein
VPPYDFDPVAIWQPVRPEPCRSHEFFSSPRLHSGTIVPPSSFPRAAMRCLALVVLLAAVPPLSAQSPERAPAPRPAVDLTGYHTVRTTLKADPKTFKMTAASGGPTVAGFVGLVVGADKQGRPVIEEIAEGSPAEQAGLRKGDLVTRVNGSPVATADAARDRLRGLVAGEAVRVAVSRDGRPAELAVTPRPASRPMQPPAAGGFGGGAGRITLGVQNEPRADGGVEITSITAGSPAERAGLRVGDILLKVDGTELSPESTLRDVLAQKRPGDVVAFALKRGDEELTLRVNLPPAEGRFGGGRAIGPTGWDDRLPRAWTRPTYRLGIIGIEYPDVKHNPKITDADWEASMFSLGSYTGRNATGQPVHGSMADYFREISYGKFTVEGKFVGWVEVSKKRAEYSTGSGTSQREKTALLTEALDKLVEKDKDALKDLDGVFFLYAGGRVQTTRGGLYWPHRATVTHQGKRWPYFIVQEGGQRMTDISVFCHEFGHMLGLPDLYARPEVPGMEGVGVWCAMSQQNGGGRPQHFSAWSKDQLGWLKPIVIDPRVRQKIVLSPIGDDPEQCIKIPVRPDGSEYFLLENRAKKGFDSVLPAEGLLIWRVLPGSSTQRVYLEESHGVEGSAGPRSFPSAVPFPSPSNDSFTPYTIPSSKSQLGGGFDVYITNIRRLPDGRVTFHIGYEYQ